MSAAGGGLLGLTFAASLLVGNTACRDMLLACLMLIPLGVIGGLVGSGVSSVLS